MDKVIRKLGNMEKRMAAFHSQLCGSTQGTQVLTLSPCLPQRVLKAGAAALFDRYQALQSVIREDVNDYVFEQSCQLADVEIQVIELSGTQDIDELIVDDINHALDQTTSLWRLTFLQDRVSDKTVILMTVHHAIIDGTGMFSLANDLFDLLQAQLDGSGISAHPERREMHPAIDDFQTNTKSVATAAPGVEPIPHAVESATEARRTRWKSMILNKEQQALLKLACQRDGVKPHSVIAAVLAKAAFDAGISPVNAALNTAVSLRFLLPALLAAETKLGCYISIASNVLPVETESIVGIAKAYDRGLMHNMVNRSRVREDVSFETVLAQTQGLKNSTQFTGGVGITNLGQVAINDGYSAFRLVDYRMFANRVSANFALVAHCFEFKGEMKLFFVYAEPTLSEPQLARFTGCFSDELMAVLAPVDDVRESA